LNFGLRTPQLQSRDIGGSGAKHQFGSAINRLASDLAYHGAFAPRGRCHSGPVVVADAPYRMPTPANGSAGAAPGADAPPAA
jgi:hypothetical protein